MVEIREEKDKSIRHAKSLAVGIIRLKAKDQRIMTRIFQTVESSEPGSAVAKLGFLHGKKGRVI